MAISAADVEDLKSEIYDELREDLLDDLVEEQGEKSGASRRDVLKMGGAALAGAAVGGAPIASGAVGVGDERLDVGDVTENTYRIAGNWYGGPAGARTELVSELGAADTGARFGADDTGAWYYWNGSAWDALPSGGASTAVDELSIAERAAVAYPHATETHPDPDSSGYLLTDVGGELVSGGGFVNTYPSITTLLNDATAAYDGDLDGTLGGIHTVSRGIYNPDGTILTTRGNWIVGPRTAYSRGVSGSGGREYHALFTHTNMPAGTPMFLMEDSAAPGASAAGSGLFGLDMEGSGPQTGDVTHVEMGEAGRTVVQLCVLADTGGDGIVAADSFSAHIIDCDIRDCGSVANGTAGVRTLIITQNVNLNVGGTFVINGPGAGSLGGADVPSCIVSTSGASVQLTPSGGRRSGGKLNTSATGQAVVKGEDIVAYDMLITGESNLQASPSAGYRPTGGKFVVVGGYVEKHADLFHIENVFFDDTMISGVRLGSAHEVTAGQGNAFRMEGNSGVLPVLDNPIASGTLDRSFVKWDDATSGDVVINGGRINEVGAGTVGTGWVVEDNRGGTRPDRYHINGTMIQNMPNGPTNNLGRLETYHGSTFRGALPHVLLGIPEQDLSTVTPVERAWYRHDGTANTFTADGAPTSDRGVYMYNGTEFRTVVNLA